jgi:hypothetical protein
MSEPKDFTERPQLWMGYCSDTENMPEDRFRIVYSDGSINWDKARWFAEGYLKTETTEDMEPWGTMPCWADDHFPRKDDDSNPDYLSFVRSEKNKGMSGGPIWLATYQELIENMKDYDKECGRKTIFLGYI